MTGFGLGPRNTTAAATSGVMPDVRTSEPTPASSYAYQRRAPAPDLPPDRSGAGCLVLLIIIGLTAIAWWLAGDVSDRLDRMERRLDQIQHVRQQEWDA